MNHLDLFSGIGGFALAAREVWGSDYQTLAFCDNDYFCQQVLTKNFPGVKIYGDIRTLTNAASNRRIRKGKTITAEKRHEKKSQYSGELAGGFERSYCDLLTGGFPCQPFSQAERRKGTDDDRYLWPQMLRVIREFRPRWIIGENVAGLLTWSEGLVLEQVCLDLEAEGYEVQPVIIPAVSVNAPHRRDRVWIVANSQGVRSRRGTSKECSYGEKWELEQNKQKGSEIWGKSERCSGNASNTPRGQRGKCLPVRETQTRSCLEDQRDKWEQNWVEVATRLCRVDDGVPGKVDRLKALGNAIVPQVAMEIMKVIKQVDK